MHKIKTEAEELSEVSQPPSHRSPDSTLFGTRACYLVSGTVFRWSPPQTEVFKAFIRERYPNHKTCDLGPLLKALDLDGYESMRTETGESVYRIVVEKVRRKISNTEKPMSADGLLTNKSASVPVSFKETSPHIGYQAPVRSAARRWGESIYDLPTTPTHPLVTTDTTQAYHIDTQTINAVPSHAVRFHPRETQQKLSPQAYEPCEAYALHERSARNTYHGVGGMATQPVRDGGESVAGGRRNAKSRRRGHIDRMAETLFYFSEELKEAQDESDEDEEFLSQVDSMKRVLDKLSQKMDNLKRLVPAEE